MITYQQYLLESEHDFFNEIMKYITRLGYTQKYILDNPETITDVTYYYVSHITHGRVPDAEPILKKYENVSNNWRAYLAFIKACNYTDEDKRQWLKEEGITDTLFDVLNYIGMPKDIQEKIILKRPDLISKINDLNPELKEKYAFELGLSRIDI